MPQTLANWSWENKRLLNYANLQTPTKDNDDGLHFQTICCTGCSWITPMKILFLQLLILPIFVKNWLWIIQKGGHWVRVKQKIGQTSSGEKKKKKKKKEGQCGQTSPSPVFSECPPIWIFQHWWRHLKEKNKWPDLLMTLLLCFSLFFRDMPVLARMRLVIKKRGGFLALYRGIGPGTMRSFISNGTSMVVMANAQRKVSEWGLRD